MSKTVYFTKTFIDGSGLEGLEFDDRLPNASEGDVGFYYMAAEDGRTIKPFAGSAYKVSKVWIEENEAKLSMCVGPDHADPMAGGCFECGEDLREERDDLKTNIPGVGMLVTSWDGAEGGMFYDDGTVDKF